jgi:hypothetical protein
MKSVIWSALGVAFILAGCASPGPIAERGTKRVFDAPYNTVWRAALEAAQQGDLEVLNADRPRGLIAARTAVGSGVPGEDIGIAVKSLGPNGTEVEVLTRKHSRQPSRTLKHWEGEIIQAIGANLKGQAAAVGGTGTGTQVYIQNHVDGATAVFPDRPSGALLPDGRLQSERPLEKLREIERRVAELREKQREQEAALGPEQDQDRREEIRAEIERLREELRIQEERLKEVDNGRR